MLFLKCPQWKSTAVLSSSLASRWRINSESLPSLPSPHTTIFRGALPSHSHHPKPFLCLSLSLSPGSTVRSLSTMFTSAFTPSVARMCMRLISTRVHEAARAEKYGPSAEPPAFHTGSHEDHTRRGGLPVPLHHGKTHKWETGKAALSSLLSALQWLTCEECGGSAQELLISPFLGSAKFPQAPTQDLDTVPLWKTLTTSPYLVNSWVRPAAHHTLSRVLVGGRKRELKCGKRPSEVTKFNRDEQENLCWVLFKLLLPMVF